MITQLFAIEWRLTRKSVLAVFLWTGIVLLTGAAGAATGLVALEEGSAVLMFLSGLSVIPALVITLMICYWKSMHGQFAVLTHSIPVRGRYLFGVKAAHMIFMILLGVVWIFVHITVWILAFAYSKGHTLAEAIEHTWKSYQGLVYFVKNSFILPLWGMTVLALLLIAVALLAVLSIGASPRFPGKGANGPIVAFLLFYVLAQVFGILGMLFLPIGVMRTPIGETSIAYEVMFNHLSTLSPGVEANEYVGFGSVLVYIVLALVAIVWAIRSLERHLQVG